MIRTLAGRVAHIGGRVTAVAGSNDVVLTFDVVGTYFPARLGNGTTPTVTFIGQNDVNNKIFIDYNDGTGEKAIDFKASGSLRRIQFAANPSGTTKQNITVTGTFNVDPLYFYQDLPIGIKDTVNDNYVGENGPRTISIRFKDPNLITQMSFSRVRLYNSLPSGIGKLKTLSILTFTSSMNITSFPQDFHNSKLKTINFTQVGDIMKNGFPLWMLNSELLEVLSLPDSIDLSGSPISKRFSLINRRKHSLLQLNVSNSGINQPFPVEFGELYKLQVLSAGNNSSPDMRLCPGLSGLTSLSNVDISRTHMPFTEVERIIQGLPALKIINIRDCEYNTDYDFTATNSTLETLELGGSNWNNGAVPSFVNKLVNLKTLSCTQLSGNLSTRLNSYGSFQNCSELVTINISRITTMPVTIPAWFSALTKLKNISAPAVFGTQVRVNDFVNNMYAFVVANAPIVGTSEDKFRSMSIDIYGTTSIDQNNSVRPSGTYQQPAGYVAGITNGTPASPMEKIWIMDKQYGHTWKVKL